MGNNLAIKELASRNKKDRCSELEKKKDGINLKLCGTNAYQISIKNNEVFKRCFVHRIPTGLQL